MFFLHFTTVKKMSVLVTFRVNRTPSPHCMYRQKTICLNVTHDVTRSRVAQDVRVDTKIISSSSHLSRAPAQHALVVVLHSLFIHLLFLADPHGLRGDGFTESEPRTY